LRQQAVKILIHIVCIAFFAMVLSGIRSGSAAASPDSGVPGYLVGFQDGADEEYAVIIEKKSQQLFLYGFQDGEFREILRFPCSTGKIPGRKTLSGDSKTPEGVYFFIKEHLDKDLSPIYGAKAFPIDYPNLMDRRKGRGGNSIWLHGTNKPLKKRDSNGCIVLEDADLLKISE
jgi:murein L,D-transpeptidase YafK